jgi:hypothetical protein
MRAKVIVAHANDLECGGKVNSATPLFPCESKQSGVAEYLAAAVQTGSAPLSLATGMTCHVLTKHTIHARLPTFTGGLEVGNDLGAVAY